MLRGCPRSGKARFAVLALLLFLAIACFISRPYLYDTVPRHYSSNPDQSSDWWAEFFTRLERTRVTAGTARIGGKAPEINWKPGTKAVRPELLSLSEHNEAKFRESHASFVRQLPLFASHLRYNPDTTGIVTTAGVANFGQAVSLVLMTRRAGSNLPIQVVLDSSSPWMNLVCAEIFPRFNASCLFMADRWAGIQHLVPKFKGYQWKSISIIASTFQNVLFLDADCLPVLNPDPLFDQGAEPFASTGLITWPDFWTQTTSSLFYKIAGGIEVPPLTSRPSSESGMLVYDKARHADTLLLAAYYNYNGPKHYYPMFIQHGAGEGDRESFLQAALVLEALRRQGSYKPPTAWMKPGLGVKKGYWDVKKIPKVHGRSVAGKWRGMFMMQLDPMEDYRAVMAAVEKAKKTETRSKRHVRRRQSEESPPPPEQDEAAAIVEGDFLTDSTFLAGVGNLTLEHNEGRVMFLHHNGVKPDFTRMLESKSGVIATNEEQKYVRMWGHPGWVVDRYGRDVEKLLWEDSMQIYCQAELLRFKNLQKVCAKMQEIHKQLYT